MFDYEEMKEDAIFSFEQQIKQLVKDAFDKGYQCGYADRKTELQITDYCNVCNHKDCDNCVADKSNPYCVPSRFELKVELSMDCAWK